MKTLLLLIASATSLYGQSFRPVDSLPTCSVIGTSFILTTATAGLNVYVCTAASGSPTLIPSNLPVSSLVSSTGTGTVLGSVCHATYAQATDGGGSPGLITPAANCTLPAKSIIYGALINWTTAATGVTNTTSIGVTGTGGGAAALMAVTAVSSLTGFATSLATLATPVKITTSGTVTVTTAVAALTAGVCEIYLFYVVSPT